MTIPPAGELVAALTGARRLDGLGEEDWSALVSTARAANLLGSLAARCRADAIEPPEHARRHLAGALQLAERQRLSVRWEAQLLNDRFADFGQPVVLLKGAAYVLSPQGIGEGRMFGDIDILVPRDALGDVEMRLMLAGWVSAKIDPYDQRYYREWMHEIPPMVHIKRGTVIDVHHDILPSTAGRSTDPAGIMARSTPVPELPALRLPSPEDLVVHSLTHVMHEGELHNGLRDLHDVHQLVGRFAGKASFWPRLLAASQVGQLAYPVACGLHLVRAFFGTAVPADVLGELQRETNVPRWLALVYRRALVPRWGSLAPASAEAARLALYVRSHRLRMPWPLLLRHLAVKGFRAMRPDAARTPPPEDARGP